MTRSATAHLAFSEYWRTLVHGFDRRGISIVAVWASLLLLVLASIFVLNPFKLWVVNNTVPLSFLSGNPVRGSRLFSSLGCSTCHALHGIGPSIGPDLGNTPSTSWSPVRIVSEMWSHSPQMWEKMNEIKFELPRVSEPDMLDLLAYLYLIRYMYESGDAEKGRALFSSKHCSDCHTLLTPSTGMGPDLSRLERNTPIAWAQRMWNHGRGMQAAMAQKHIPWPTFQEQEMVDLLTFIQKHASEPHEEDELFPADPANGKKLFRDKGCSSCHSINGRGGKVGPDLGSQHGMPRTITQFAGLMWNHSPQMLARMDRETTERIHFAAREMADLISYLYVVRYLESVGIAKLGKEIFQQKRCADCHGSDGRGSEGGPNLARPLGYFSPQMAYTIWAHGPQMYRKMRENNIAWPTLGEQEMLNVMAFLSSL